MDAELQQRAAEYLVSACCYDCDRFALCNLQQRAAEYLVSAAFCVLDRERESALPAAHV